MSTSPNKRQRITGSFSPPSPPYHLAKPAGTKTTVVQPNTPTSPPYMSSVSQSNGASWSTATSQGYSPPSSIAMSTQVSQNPVGSSTNTFPTPASTVATSSYGNKEGDMDAQMNDASNTQLGDDDVIMMDSDNHRRSNHDSCLGKAAGLERLNADLGSLYKICQHPFPMSSPHPSQNLIALYGLSSTASSFLRKDPVSGAKINKLRKSYEGKIKALQIAGNNKAFPAPQNEGFMNLLALNDEEYHGMNVVSRNVLDGPSADFLARLDSAVKMTPAKLPHAEDQKWKKVIGSDETGKTNTAKKTSQTNLTAAGAREASVPSPTLKASKLDRPERHGTKRRYIETSFKGYGEGYADDDVADSTGGEEDGRNGGTKKKRRKDFNVGSPLGMNDRAPGYNVGLVGGIRR